MYREEHGILTFTVKWGSKQIYRKNCFRLLRSVVNVEIVFFCENGANMTFFAKSDEYIKFSFVRKCH